MSYRQLRLAREGGIATVTIDREKKLNALDAEVLGELRAAVAELSADDGVGVAILTGAGEKAFVAGADIGMLVDQGVEGGKANARLGQALTLEMEASRLPILAAINGFALGGGLELALACDLRFASSRAKLGLPEVSLGILPGYGGTQRLPRLIGTGPALRLILTGDPVDAAEAHRLGLVDGIFEPAELQAGVRGVARRILSRGPKALAAAKEAVRRGTQLSLEAGLALEADLFGMISATDEMREGMRAFLDKRKPAWLRE
jgi:enoyl-CoA hydratase